RCDPDLRLTMVGDGRDGDRWKGLAVELGLDACVTWLSWVPFDDLPAIYGTHGVFLFPSLHDSSGNVLLEAMSHGLPIVCLKIGGPGVIVDEACGRVVPVEHGDFHRVVSELAQHLNELTSNPEHWAGEAAKTK